MLWSITEFVLFAASTGIFFNEGLRKNTFAVFAAGMIALVSTVLLFIQLKNMFIANTSSTTVNTSVSITPADEIFWLTVKDSAVPGLFEEFEKRFPTSKHAGEARAKIQQLKNGQQVITPPITTPRSSSNAAPSERLCVTFNNKQICE